MAFAHESPSRMDCGFAPFPFIARRSSVLARHGGVELLCAATSPCARRRRTAIVTGRINFIKYVLGEEYMYVHRSPCVERGRSTYAGFVVVYPGFRFASWSMLASPWAAGTSSIRDLGASPCRPGGLARAHCSLLLATVFGVRRVLRAPLGAASL